MNRFSQIGVMVLFVLFASITSTVYLFWQVQDLKQQIASLPNPLIPNISPSITLAPATPSITPEISITTTTTPRPTTTLGTPTPFTGKTITYSLPGSWSQLKLAGSTFSVGYNSNTMKIVSNDTKGLLLHFNATKYSYADFIAIEKAYDGGSRHSFITGSIGSYTKADNLPEYHEKEYFIDGANCLFLIGIQPSQSLPTWGMCPTTSGKAVLINMLTMNTLEIETMLKTIKL